jgi:hypothetical protein
MGAITVILRHSPKPFIGDKAAIARVRGVLMNGRDVLVPQQDKELVAHRLLDEIVALKRGRSEG